MPHATIINCTLKRSPADSNTGALAEVLLAALQSNGATCEVIRAVDLNLLPGVSSDEGAGDDWPAVREKLIAMFKKWINTEKYRATSAAGGALVDDLTGVALTKEIDNVQKSLNEVGKKVFVAEKK